MGAGAPQLSDERDRAPPIIALCDLHVINVVVSKLAACSGRIHCMYVCCTHSQTLFFLLCGGGKEKSMVNIV